jgi:hypothetical protein
MAQSYSPRVGAITAAMQDSQKINPAVVYSLHSLERKFNKERKFITKNIT